MQTFGLPSTPLLQRALRLKACKNLMVMHGDQGDRFLIFFSKRFAYFKKCLYLCAIITKLKSYHYAKKAKRI